MSEQGGARYDLSAQTRRASPEDRQAMRDREATCGGRDRGTWRGAAAHWRSRERSCGFCPTVSLLDLVTVMSSISGAATVLVLAVLNGWSPLVTLLGLTVPAVIISVLESFLRRMPMSEWFMETTFEGPHLATLCLGTVGVGHTLGWGMSRMLLACLLIFAALAATGAVLAVPRLMLLSVWRRQQLPGTPDIVLDWGDDALSP